MKITAIYGTNHIGSTVLLARELIHALQHQPDDITEFFLPRDFNHFCSGCGACFVAKNHSVSKPESSCILSLLQYHRLT